MSSFSLRRVGANTAGAARVLFHSAVIAGALLVAGQSHASTVLLEDFSTGENGWVTSGGVSTVALGGPGGVADPYLLTDDTMSGPVSQGGTMSTTFGLGWTGDLTAFNGGTLSFDFRHVGTIETPINGSFGRVTVTGTNGNRAMAEGYSPVLLAPATSWTSAVLDFDASTFGKSETFWAGILSDVQMIEIRLESWGSVTEQVGLDNVQLAPVPLPASMLLLLGGLGMMFAMRRRNASA